jgi:hypothetical protein
MKAGQFNIDEYLEKLYEGAEAAGVLPNKEGMIIPEENQKAYQWLKKEFQRGKVEVKVEMKLGDSKFEPGYDLQTDLKSVKDFKPGMFGEIKTADTKTKGKSEDKKEKPSFKTEKEEVESEEKEVKSEKKEVESEEREVESEEREVKSEKKAVEKEEKKEEEKPKFKKEEGKPEVKKIDLKTKKK